MSRHILTLPCLALCLASGVLAQGDDYSKATLVASVSALPFDADGVTPSNGHANLEGSIRVRMGDSYSTAGVSADDNADGTSQGETTLNGLAMDDAILVQVDRNESSIPDAETPNTAQHLTSSIAGHTTAGAISSTGMLPLGTWKTRTVGWNSYESLGLGSTTVHRDAFYQSMTSSIGDYDVDTLDGAYGSKSSVHTGTRCPAICSNCNDHYRVSLSKITLSTLTTNDRTLFQVGEWDSNYGLSPMVNVVSTTITDSDLAASNTIPKAAPMSILAGDIWHLMAWYPSTPAGAGSSNFTIGLGLIF